MKTKILADFQICISVTLIAFSQTYYCKRTPFNSSTSESGSGENDMMTLVKDFKMSTNCVKSVRIRSFPGPYFPAFGLNTERYGVHAFL